LVVVCDGMGATGHGDQASSVACGQFVARVQADLPRLVAGRVSRGEVMSLALEESDRAIANAIARSPELRGMGTTLTAALVGTEEVQVVHVGDSRAYRLRDGVLEQLTEDHSVTGQLVAAGRLTAAEAREYPHRDQLLQALGRGVKLAPQSLRLKLSIGESLVLCSDGLTRMLAEEQIAESLAEHRSCVRACRSLTEMACARGARDNVTVCVVRRIG
jgi:protein phosphatase